MCQILTTVINENHTMDPNIGKIIYETPLSINQYYRIHQNIDNFIIQYFQMITY